MTATNDNDQLQRFLFENIGVRGEIVKLNSAWQTALANHTYPTVVAEQLGQALAASLLLSATLKFEGALIIQIQGDGPISLLAAQATDQQIVKGLAQVSSVSPIWDNANRELNGYGAFATGNLATSGTANKAHALCGDFTKVHIAQFGGLDILFDPYTGGATGEPRMIVTSLMDGDAVQNGTAFANLIEA